MFLGVGKATESGDPGERRVKAWHIDWSIKDPEIENWK